MDNFTTNKNSNNSRGRGREEQRSTEEGESTLITSPTTKNAIENELKAWLSRPKPQLTDAQPLPSPPPPPPSKNRSNPPPSILSPTNKNNVPTKSSVPLDDEKVKTIAFPIRSILHPTTTNKNISPPTAPSSTPTNNKHGNNKDDTTDDKFIKTIANVMQMKQHGKLTHPTPPPPPPPQARRNINNNNNSNHSDGNHNDSTQSIIDTIIQQRDDDVIKKQHKNGKKKHHHRSNSSSSSLPSSSNKHHGHHHTNSNVQQQEQLTNVKNNSNKQGVLSSPDFDVLTFDQFTHADNNTNTNNGYHSDSSYMTTYSAPLYGYNHPRNKKKLRRKRKEQADELYTQTLMERACGVVSSPATNDEEEDDDAGSQTSRTSQKSFSSVFTTLKSYLRKSSNDNKGANGYCSDGGAYSYNRTSFNNKRRGTSKQASSISTRKTSTKYRSTNTSVSADKYNNNVESTKKERSNSNFGLSETDVTHTTVDSSFNGSPVRCLSNNGNNNAPSDETSKHDESCTKVFDLPWHDTTSQSYSNSSRLVGLHGLYSGPVNNEFKPNGSGTLILEGNKFLKFYGIWNDGILVTNLMNEDEMKLHHDWKKQNSRLDGYDSSASSSCSSKMSNRSSRSRYDRSYRKRQHTKRKKDKKKKRKKSSKEYNPDGEFTTTNNRLLNVRSGHPQQEHVNQHSSTLATSTLATEYDDPTTATTNSNNNKPRRRRRIQRYTLGEVARTPRDMVILRSNNKAIESASTLKKYDQAFLKRSNGLW